LAEIILNLDPYLINKLKAPQKMNKKTSSKAVKNHKGTIFILLLIFVFILVIRGKTYISYALENIGLVLLNQTSTRLPENSLSQPFIQFGKLIEQSINYDHENDSSWRWLGFFLISNDQSERALTAWQNSEMMTDELVWWGTQERQKKQFNRALRWYNLAARLETVLSDPWYYSGLAYEGLEQYSNALQAYDQAVRIGKFRNIKSSSLYYRLALIYHRRSVPPNLEKALAAYDTAIRLDDFNTEMERADTHYGRGAIYELLERPSLDAIKEYEQALALNPNHEWAYLRLGYAQYSAYGDVVLAVKNIYQAISLWPDNIGKKQPYKFLGDVYLNAGLTNEAIKAYRKAQEIDANDVHIKQILENLTDKNIGNDQ